METSIIFEAGRTRIEVGMRTSLAEVHFFCLRCGDDLVEVPKMPPVAVLHDLRPGRLQPASSPAERREWARNMRQLVDHDLACYERGKAS